MDWDSLLQLHFLLIPFLVAPGPANLMNFSIGTRLGFWNGLSFVGGLNTATLVWSLFLLPAGSANLVRDWIPLTLFQCLAAFYIAYLGWRLIRTEKSLNSKEMAGNSGFMAGLLLQIINPKLLVILVFLLLQDLKLSPSGSVIFAVYFTLLNVAVHSSFLLAGSWLNKALGAGNWIIWCNRTCGVALSLIAVWMVVDTIPVYPSAL